MVPEVLIGVLYLHIGVSGANLGKGMESNYVEFINYISLSTGFYAYRANLLLIIDISCQGKRNSSP